MTHIYHIPIKFAEEDQGKYLGADGIFHSMAPMTVDHEGVFDVTGVDELTVDIPYQPVTIRRNGTYDVTGNDQATVFVSGSGDPVLKEKTVTENGVYIADDELADGYSEVTVDLSNVYYPADEGKVVHDGELIAQGNLEITENGVYDTSLVNEANVNVNALDDVTFLNMLPIYEFTSSTRTDNNGITMTRSDSYSDTVIFNGTVSTGSSQDWAQWTLSSGLSSGVKHRIAKALHRITIENILPGQRAVAAFELSSSPYTKYTDCVFSNDTDDVIDKVVLESQIPEVITSVGLIYFVRVHYIDPSYRPAFNNLKITSEVLGVILPE